MSAIDDHENEGKPAEGESPPTDSASETMAPDWMDSLFEPTPPTAKPPASAAPSPPRDDPGAPTWQLHPGQIVDRYVVEAQIGEGGLAVVYRVHHNILGTRHALKVLKSRGAAMRARLVQEGRIQAGLRHAHVIPVTDVIDIDGHAGLLMDYVEGPSLAQWLDANRADATTAVEMFLQIVSGVGAAHAVGVVHRDLKPENVMVEQRSAGPHLWVMDFGLARHLKSTDARQTHVGTVMGTPRYMAPEQWKAESDVDERADIFALGGILYRLVCGRPAFAGNDMMVLRQAITTGQYTPPEDVVQGLPAPVLEAVKACLAVEARMRPADCSTLYAVLAGTAAAPEVASPPAGVGAVPDEQGPLQLELSIRLDPDEALRVRVSWEPGGSGGEHQLVPRVSLDQLRDLTRRFAGEARRREPATAELTQLAHQAWVQLLAPRAEALPSALATGSRPIVVRIMAHSPVLHAIPWEQLGEGCWPSGHPPLRVVRAVRSGRPVVHREVQGALRALADQDLDRSLVAQEADAGGARRASKLHWLPPLGVDHSGPEGLLERIRVPPRPHVLAIRGALQKDPLGAPLLQLGSLQRDQVSAEALGALLDRRVCPDLRLVVLEGHGPLASAAARHIATDGVVAVLTWLWPTAPAERAQLIREFLTLLSQDEGGDAIEALSLARRHCGVTTAALGATLYLRGPSGRLFTFSHRRPELASGRDPVAASSLNMEQRRLADDLGALLAAPGASTLLLADGFDAQGEEVGRAQLHAQLQEQTDADLSGSMASQLQLFELLEDREELRAVFQEILEEVLHGRGRKGLGLIDWLARARAPGLSISLLYLPLLAGALTRLQPDRDVVVVQPLQPGSTDRLRTFVRPAGEQRWRRGDRGALDRLDLDRQHVVLHLFGGSPTPKRGLVGDPVLTENDHLQHLESIDRLPNQLLAYFRRHPCAIVGFDPMDWSQRASLQRLVGSHALRPRSLAVLNPDAPQAARRYWQSESGPAGRGANVRLARCEDLAGLVAAQQPS